MDVRCKNEINYKFAISIFKTFVIFLLSPCQCLSMSGYECEFCCHRISQIPQTLYRNSFFFPYLFFQICFVLFYFASTSIVCLCLAIFRVFVCVRLCTCALPLNNIRIITISELCCKTQHIIFVSIHFN